MTYVLLTHSLIQLNVSPKSGLLSDFYVNEALATNQCFFFGTEVS